MRGVRNFELAGNKKEGDRESQKGLERIPGLEKVASHPFQPMSPGPCPGPCSFPCNLHLHFALCTGIADWLDPSPSLFSLSPPVVKRFLPAGYTRIQVTLAPSSLLVLPCHDFLPLSCPVLHTALSFAASRLH